jgi:homocysteine S-methyltransferase
MLGDRVQAIIQDKGFAILDGAMGTELERRGYTTSLPLWSALANLDAAQIIAQIHDDYISAGADIITTNTFRTTTHTLGKRKIADHARYLTKSAVSIAQASASRAERDIIIAGSLAPLEDCYSPELVPSEEIIHAVYTDQITILIESGVDVILCETMINHAEILIAARICKERHFPFLLSFTSQDDALLDGTDLKEMIVEANKYQPMALLLNCRSTDEITAGLQVLANSFDGLTGAYGNGPGHPDLEVGWRIAEGAVAGYVNAAKQWYELGARIIGGCCGTTPQHIEGLAELRKNL